VWFDILNSQSGATAKHLVGSSFQFGSLSCFIHMAKAHPSTPLCQCCQCWGHSMKACHVQALRCLQCTGPHTKANHCKLAGCCQGNPSVNPPQPTTPTVSTAKGNRVQLTNNALTGSTASTGPGFPHGLLWPWMGWLLT
jgi:hypothetical protein